MEVYRTAYRLIYHAGQRHTAVVGVAVIIVLTLLSGEMFSNSIPYDTLWVLFCGSMRMLIVVLPRPGSGGSIVPTEKPLPKAVMAVSITEPAPPDACPERDEMTALLPADVRALIR
jgi:hypothetical protein